MNYSASLLHMLLPTSIPGHERPPARPQAQSPKRASGPLACGRPSHPARSDSSSAIRAAQVASLPPPGAPGQRASRPRATTGDPRSTASTVAQPGLRPPWRAASRPSLLDRIPAGCIAKLHPCSPRSFFRQTSLSRFLILASPSSLQSP
jgi:hypothetical protein